MICFVPYVWVVELPPEVEVQTAPASTASSSGGTRATAAEDPLFQRSEEHYTSQAQTPFDHITDYMAVIQQGSLTAAAFPIAPAIVMTLSLIIFRTILSA